ncbi:MAG: lipoprotein-34, partial [Halothiobacillaceae bacterium]
IDAEDEITAAIAPLGGSVTLSEYTHAGEVRAEAKERVATVGVDLQDPNLKVARDGRQRWLVAKGDAQRWWEASKAFWATQNIELLNEMPALGVLETVWIEDRSTIPMTSIFSKPFALLYSTSLRDQYVMRIEPGVEPGTSEIYITHRGLQQEQVGETTQWLPRAPEVELEVAMLKRFALYAGAKSATVATLSIDKAGKFVYAKLNKKSDSEAELQVALEFANSWRRVGNALFQMEIDVEDFNRAKGDFYVSGKLAEQEVPRGLLARIFSKNEVPKPTPFVVKLVGKGESTQVLLTDRTGVVMRGYGAETFLEQLQQQINK